MGKIIATNVGQSLINNKELGEKKQLKSNKEHRHEINYKRKM